jgi:hypothetical protein
LIVEEEEKEGEKSVGSKLEERLEEADGHEKKRVLLLELSEHASRHRLMSELTSKMNSGQCAASRDVPTTREPSHSTREMLVPKSRMQASEGEVRRWIKLSAR